MSKASDKRDAISEYWARPCWPCVILAVDPARISGYAIILGFPGTEPIIAELGDVDCMTRHVEKVVQQAHELARAKRVPVVMVTEDWNAGRWGMKQLIGMGAARGAWERAHVLQSRSDAQDMVGRINIGLPRLARVNVQTWRSKMIPIQTHIISGKSVRFGRDDFKDAALQSAPRFYKGSSGIAGAVRNGLHNAIEASLIGYYACRSNEVRRVLPKSWLAKHGITKDIK